MWQGGLGGVEGEPWAVGCGMWALGCGSWAGGAGLDGESDGGCCHG